MNLLEPCHASLPCVGVAQRPRAWRCSASRPKPDDRASRVDARHYRAVHWVRQWDTWAGSVHADERALLDPSAVHLEGLLRGARRCGGDERGAQGSRAVRPQCAYRPSLSVVAVSGPLRTPVRSDVTVPERTPCRQRSAVRTRSGSRAEGVTPPLAALAAGRSVPSRPPTGSRGSAWRRCSRSGARCARRGARGRP
jgi:hypothetical protein